ncbi:general transcription factor II-I repeat domain-containing protein 2 [Trichonephila clavata]|uniref:General transcription factor II-I repeat domain-containing protein 2 n=1 Tax=Trichonephila clavata TaxID=2740835 RepID=A0A8X6FB98_TRICU|nr:general transcription factor II-I repeat domain-containing protein 2 [Trichonephila clavata]
MRSNVTRHLVDTSGNRVENIAENISSQLFDKNGHVEWFSLALDKSTDVSDTAQVFIYIRVDKSYEVHEELFDMYSIHGTTTGRDSFEGVEMAINQKNLRWKNLKYITTDGGKNMSGKDKGVVALVSKKVSKLQIKQARCGLKHQLSNPNFRVYSSARTGETNVISSFPVRITSLTVSIGRKSTALCRMIYYFLYYQLKTLRRL